MENTLSNREMYNTSTEPQVRSAPMANGYQPNQGEIVFFQCDLDEMFGITIDYPGIRGALNRAFNESKNYIPVDTGLMKASYTMRTLSDTMVELYFDPQKIIGKTRKGKTVKEYYPQYVGSSGSANRAWNWLTIVMRHFYDKLITEVRNLIRSKKTKERKEANLSVATITLAALGLQDTMKENVKNIVEERRESRRIKRENDLQERKRQQELRQKYSLHRRVS